MTTVHATTATQKTVDGPSNSAFDLLNELTIQRIGEVDEPLPPTSSRPRLVLLR